MFAYPIAFEVLHITGSRLSKTVNSIPMRQLVVKNLGCAAFARNNRAREPQMPILGYTERNLE
jgi:hypothetical protein